MSRGTIHRTLRVEDDLWGAAKSIADGRGENLSEVLRQALRDYVSQYESQPLQATYPFAPPSSFL